MSEMSEAAVEVLTDAELVVALVRAADALPGDEEHATLPPQVPGLPSSAARHLQNLPAYRGLARARGLDLEAVLRAALHDDLAAIVRLPAEEGRSAT